MNDLNLKGNDIMLVNAKGVANGKVSLEFAQLVNTGDKAVNLTNLINESDDRFNQVKTRRAWMTGTKESIAKYFPQVNVTDLEVGAVLEIGQLNPTIEKNPLNIQITETTIPSKAGKDGKSYDLENIDTKAKRAGKDGDFIMKDGQYIFTKINVVVGDANHFIFPRNETTRVAVGSSDAAAEAIRAELN